MFVLIVLIFADRNRVCQLHVWVEGLGSGVINPTSGHHKPS